MSVLELKNLAWQTSKKGKELSYSNEWAKQFTHIAENIHSRLGKQALLLLDSFVNIYINFLNGKYTKEEAKILNNGYIAYCKKSLERGL